ncbi:MAG: hypothetical protein WDO15_11420 [Bacteroidota bacterium]
MKGKIRDIENRLIPKLIGKAQHNTLVSQLKAKTTTTDEKTLIAMLEPIVSKRALYEQLPFMRIQVNENGVFVFSGTDDVFKASQLAGSDDVKVLRDSLECGALGYLSDEKELKQYVIDNIGSYPLIAASSAYTSRPAQGTVWTPENTGCDKHFIV